MRSGFTALFGLVIAPGFIDPHTHFDAAVSWDPFLTPSPLLGVTTVLAGNCGFTLAPLTADASDYIMRMLSMVEGMPLEALAAGCDWSPRSFEEFVAKLDGQPVPSRHAEPDEFVRLAATVRDHIGTSLGITPPIGPFSDRAKQLLTDMSIAGQRPISWNVMLVEAKHTDVYESQIVGGDYAHARGGSVIALTVPELSRLRLSFDNGMILNMVPEWGEVLALPLPERKAALADATVRQRLFDGYARMPHNSVRTRLEWPHVRLGATYSPSTHRYANRTLADIAAEQGCDPLEALLDIVVADDLRTDIWPPAPGDDDESWRLRQQVWRDPRVVLGGGDAGAHLDMTQSWRYFVTLLGEHVREHQRLTLEEAVHLITLRPARLFGLRDRGRVAVASVADLTIFDPARVGSGPLSMRSDLPGGAARIWSHGIGLAHVVVGGVEVVHDDELTGAKGGSILRSGRDTVTVTPRDFPSGGS
ncbi:MAG TPA: amidohydrolase family protein [Acidimicrobiales bacterium]|nr:amidohydrolase family protein [Acidimicrobiales bacterium]